MKGKKRRDTGLDTHETLDYNEQAPQKSIHIQLRQSLFFYLSELFCGKETGNHALQRGAAHEGRGRNFA